MISINQIYNISLEIEVIWRLVQDSEWESSRLSGQTRKGSHCLAEPRRLPVGERWACMVSPQLPDSRSCSLSITSSALGLSHSWNFRPTLKLLSMTRPTKQEVPGGEGHASSSLPKGRALMSSTCQANCWALGYTCKQECPGIMLRIIDSRARLPGLESQLCHILATIALGKSLSPWVS